MDRVGAEDSVFPGEDAGAALSTAPREPLKGLRGAAGAAGVFVPEDGTVALFSSGRGSGEDAAG
ncbi:hypothetical protein ACSFCX_25570, partial [Yokenella regensburgei]|uniref:hypothetical protein n=1 Tax=Yokenella regensburgei TaxID=158877 RepID=UPI003EDA0AA1